MASAPPIKKKRGLWTEENLTSAMAAVIEHRLTQRQAALKYNIPRRTLRNHLQSGKTTKKIGRDPILSKQQEQDLVERIIKFSKIGMPLTAKVIRTQAYRFCEQHGIENNFNKQTGKAGRDWLKMFLKRNPNISNRKAQLMNPARAQKLNKPIVNQHFQEIKKLYDELDILNHPERLYNVDEKGCRLTLHHQQTVLAEKGSRRVHMVAHEHAENVTIAACVSAAGNVIPPMIIFKGKRLKPEFTDNLPPGTLVKMAPKGSMTTPLFIDLMNHLGKFKAPGKCLLVFDGASCHLDYDIVEAAEQNDIVLYCLPSNTTHELQPLDKSVNKSFENYWDQEVVKFMYNNPTKKLSKARFNSLFSKVWAKCMTQNNINSGFRATGLFPFDPQAIPEDAYAPSLLTENQNPALQNEAAPSTSTNRFPTATSDLQRRVVNDGSDTDLTDVGDSPQMTYSRSEVDSPNILNSYTENIERNEISDAIHNMMPGLHSPKSYSRKRLVSYSSSLESLITNNDSKKKTEVTTDKLEEPLMLNLPGPSGVSKNAIRPISNDSSPIEINRPGPSGLNKHIPRHTLDLDSSSSEASLDMEKFIRMQSMQRFNIYDPYSDSNDSNDEFSKFIDKGEITPNKNYTSGVCTTDAAPQLSATDDSDNDVSLIELKNKKSVSSTFKELLPTPNFAIIKSHTRRKALNYKGQRIVKDLFEKKQELSKKGGKAKDKIKNKNKQGRVSSNKNEKKTDKQIKPKTKRVIKNNKSVDLNDTWYCHACKLEKQEDMRSCMKCFRWYHEECVGLTKDDNDTFFCPDCV